MQQRTRGFEIVSHYHADVIQLPQRQTKQAAGYDFASAYDLEILPQHVTLVPTGVKAYMPANEFLGLYIRSSIALKKGVVMINSVGIIDADYYNNADNEGEIFFALYNPTTAPVSISAGERIGQGIFQTYLQVDEEQPPSIRQGGFGSTT